jgi:hypothetical protein
MWKISRQPSPVQIVIDKKQPENVEYFNSMGSTITNDARCTREIKSRSVMPKAAFNKMKTLSQACWTLRKKLVKCYIWSICLYSAETWTLRKVDQKYTLRSEMWRISVETDCVKNANVLRRVKEERNVLCTIKGRLTLLVASCL